MDLMDDIPLVFKLSFMYYTLLGTILLMLIAYIVSFFTGGCEPFDERLLAPFRRNKNWQAKPSVKPLNDVLYREVHLMEELRKRPSLGGVEGRRLSLDVA